VGAGGSVPGRCLVAQGGVPAVVVVFGFAVGDDDPGLGEGPEGVDVEAFVSDPAVERFDVAVPPGFAGRDKGKSDALPGPVGHRRAGQFGAVVATQHGRVGAAGGRGGRVRR